MRVAVQVNRTALSVWPLPHRVVRKDDLDVVPLQHAQIFDARPRQPSSHREMVMVTGDKPLDAVQPVEGGVDLLKGELVIGKIPQMPNGVARRDHAVPMLDQSAIVVANICECASAFLDQALMAEMGVCNEPVVRSD